MIRCLALLLLVALPGFSTTYYVSNSGSDSNNGTSTGTPWQTISHVNAQSFSAGDVILFNRGNLWREQIQPIVSGSSGNLIRFGAYGTGAQPIISGSNLITGWTNTTGTIYTASVSVDQGRVFNNGTELTRAGTCSTITSGQWQWASSTLCINIGTNPSSNTIEASPLADANSRYGFYVHGHSYFGIDSLHFTEGRYGVSQYTSIATDVEITNCTFDYTVSSGIITNDTVGGGTGWLIGGNTFNHIGLAVTDHGIYADGLTNSTISGNTFNNATGYGVQLQDNSTGNLVTGNTSNGNAKGFIAVYDNGLGGSQNNVITYNLSSGGDGYCLLSGGSSLNVGNLFSNNTCYQNTVTVIAIVNGSNFGTIKNNILRSNLGPLFDVENSSTAVSDYNDVTQASGFIYWNGTSYSTLSAYTSAIGNDTHSITSYPLFVTAGSNFNLQSGSPCRNTGTRITAAAQQVAEWIPDMGAFEYVPGHLGTNTVSMLHNRFKSVSYAAPPVLPAFVSNNQGASAETTALTTKTGNGCATDAYCTQVVDPSLAGNTLVVAVTYGNATSNVPTISDDKTNTYTHCSSEAHDSTNNRWVDIYYVIGATTGTRKITVTWSTGVTNAQVSVAQFRNVTSFDVCAANASGTAATTFQSGSLTTTAANDLLYTFAVGTNPATNTGSFTAGSQAGITWNLLGPDRRDGSVAQFGVLSSAGTINPQLTISSSSAYAAVTIALKSGSAGTSPAGMYVACMQSYNGANSSTGPYANQIGCPVGNLLVGEMNGGYPQVVTSVVGGTNGNWTQCGANATAGVSGDPITAVYYVSQPSSTNEGITINTTGTADTSMWFYSIVGASTKNYCGQQTETATNPGLSGSSISPFSSAPGAVTSGMTLISYGQFSNTVIALTAPSGAVFDSNTVGGQSIDGPSVPDENNLRGHGTAVPGAQTWTLTETTTGGGGVSAGEIDSFPAPGAVFATYASGQATSTATLAITKTLLNSGDALVVAIGMYNSGTGRTVSKVCLDGTTCAVGNSFTQATSAASTADSTEANTDVWYLLNAGSAGSKTITVTLSGSASNVEATVYDVSGISAFDVAGHVNHASSGGTSVTGASVTTTGNPEFVVACAGVSASVIQNPTTGNEFINGGTVYTNTADGVVSLLTTTAGAHQPSWYTSGYLNGSTAAFK